MNQRSITRILDAVRTLEGAGFEVRRPFPTPALDSIDPFLLLDEMGPKELGPGEAKGAPDHPHRGFETVTYMLAGRMQHKDSAGNRGDLGPGDVQWMTAGSGVVHSEMPAPELLEKGGRMHGFQLWVNLPRHDKMMSPRYQEIPGRNIPESASTDGKVRVRVIAGESMGVRAVIETRTPILYLHFTVQPGGRFVQAVPPGYAGFVYVFEGEGRFGAEEKRARDGQLAQLGRDGDSLQVVVPGGLKSPMEALLIAGVPLEEPVARYGPFVMNTREEIAQAVEDYRSGRLGRI